MRGNRTCTYPNHLLYIPGDSIDSPVFPLRDMELLHYWATSTAQSISDNVHHHQLWRVTVPLWAFDNQFLLHGLLAITALHRKREGDDPQPERAIESARYHQQQALTLYIPLLQTITPKNCHALFAFSIIFGAISFAFLLEDSDPEPDSSPAHDHRNGGHNSISTPSPLLPSPPGATTTTTTDGGMVKRFIEACDAFLGATAIGIQAGAWLLQGAMATYMVPPAPILKDFHVNDREFQAALTDLLALAETLRGEEVRAGRVDAEVRFAAYVKAICGLGTILMQDPRTLELSVLIAWPVIAETDYLNLLRQADPFAMTILGHYGVALDFHGEKMWMTAGLGRRLTNVVYAQLEEKFKPRLEWATRRVAMGYREKLDRMVFKTDISGS